MWRTILKKAIQIAVASGLVDKAKSKVVGWLKRKFQKTTVTAAAKLDAAQSTLERRRQTLEHDDKLVEKLPR